MGWGGGRVEEGADNTYLLSKRNSISKLHLISYKCMCLWRQLKSSLHLLPKWRAAFELCILVWRPSLIANGGHRLCSFMFLRQVSRGTAVILVRSHVGTSLAHSLIYANQVIKCSVAMWADTFGNLTLGVLVCGCICSVGTLYWIVLSVMAGPNTSDWSNLYYPVTDKSLAWVQ